MPYFASPIWKKILVNNFFMFEFLKSPDFTGIKEINPKFRGTFSHNIPHQMVKIISQSKLVGQKCRFTVYQNARNKPLKCSKTLTFLLLIFSARSINTPHSYLIYFQLIMLCHCNHDIASAFKKCSILSPKNLNF